MAQSADNFRTEEIFGTIVFLFPLLLFWKKVREWGAVKAISFDKQRIHMNIKTITKFDNRKKLKTFCQSQALKYSR
jgi:hypothetical protein